MTKNRENVIAKLNELANGKKSQWIQDAQEREQNSKQLRRAQLIALKILRKLRSNKEENVMPRTQVELAEMLDVTPQQVNKWVKGNGNYTFETIDRIEKVLGIELIHVNEPKTSLLSCTYVTEVVLHITKPRPTEFEKKKSTTPKGKVIPFQRENTWEQGKQYAYN